MRAVHSTVFATPVPWSGQNGVSVAVDRWVRNYLCRTHPRLGRSGPVCPYVPHALAAQALSVAVVTGRPVHTGEVVGLMDRYRDWFTARTDPADLHQALLVLFPALGPGDVAWAVDEAQRISKTAFVRVGLMIGQFHDGPPAAGGIRNPAFRPLYAPVPLLAVRRMVRSDLPFLADDTEHLTAYRALFPHGAHT
ncbi:DUF6875 domain-containing protein [Actinosynnema sp. NPDC023794]